MYIINHTAVLTELDMRQFFNVKISNTAKTYYCLCDKLKYKKVCPLKMVFQHNTIATVNVTDDNFFSPKNGCQILATVVACAQL